MKPNSIHISGARWFERTNGNTYHSVEIFVNGQRVHYDPFSYGYGDSYLDSAWTWLKKYKYIRPRKNNSFWRYCTANKIEFSSSVSDVARKKDL
jgi:hypothetical protein